MLSKITGRLFRFSFPVHHQSDDHRIQCGAEKNGNHSSHKMSPLAAEQIVQRFADAAVQNKKMQEQIPAS